MEKNIELTLVYETYKELLTENMREIFELYYYSDLSLREIGEQKNISYQAVNDTLKKVEKLLNNYELKLNLSKIRQQIIILNEKLEKSDVDLGEIKEIVKKLGEV